MERRAVILSIQVDGEWLIVGELLDKTVVTPISETEVHAYSGRCRVTGPKWAEMFGARLGSVVVLNVQTPKLTIS